MRVRQRPSTFFDTYRSRLLALATTHAIKPQTLKILIERALSEELDCFSYKHNHPAHPKLAELKVSPREIRFLLQRRIVR